MPREIIHCDNDSIRSDPAIETLIKRSIFWLIKSHNVLNMSVLTCNGRYFAWRSGFGFDPRFGEALPNQKEDLFQANRPIFFPKQTLLWRNGQASYENITENKVPKTGPEDLAHDLDPFAEMAQLMRKSS